MPDDPTEDLARRALTLALRTSAAMLAGRDEAADIAQDVAVDVLSSLDRLRDPAAFDAWVHRITVRHVLRHVRRRRGRRSAETPLALAAEPAVAFDDAAIAVRDELAAALARLRPKQRLALVLRYVHDLSDEQIAAALDCRPGTVHALLSRGRAALRNDPLLADLAPGGTR